jgi:hypothetical protein
MAALSHDASVRDVTSLDHVHVAPSRPEARRPHLPIVGRLRALSGDETVAAKHRSRRDGTARGSSQQNLEEQLTVSASVAFAVLSLVLVSAVALGSTLLSAAILHLVSPDRRFDTFRALHEPVAIALLLGLAVLWLLPPYPWAVQPAHREPKDRRLFRTESAA